MKVTSVELHPSGSSNFAVLSYRDPSRQNPYIVKAIMGLDVDEITPQYYALAEDLVYPAGEDGGPGSSNRYYTMSLRKRTIVIRIALNPNFAENKSYSDLRDDMYRYIAKSRSGYITLQFKNGPSISAVISGFITKFESALFNKEPEIQITINCDSDPMLHSFEPISVDVESLDPGIISITDNVSTAPHGFVAQFICVENSDSFKITTYAGTEFDITHDFVVGSGVYFSSEENNKRISEGATNLADKLSLTSLWPIIFPGPNTFYFTPSNKFNLLWLTYYETFWGI